MKLFFSFLFLCSSILLASVIPEKVLICGVCKDIEKAVPNTIASITALSEQFLDYKVIIYENNSSDRTSVLFKEWATTNPHVLFISENVETEVLRPLSRTEKIARARNRVLDEVGKRAYDDYKYVIWADLDFLDPWDVQHVVETIENPEQEWDAVLAYGAYDLFAFRDHTCPVGFELVGALYWDHLDEISSRFVMQPSDPWRRVYSAFGGLGLYKREAIRGCRYSGAVTKELEQEVAGWLSLVRSIDEVPLLREYEHLLAASRIIDCFSSTLPDRKKSSTPIGIRLHNTYGSGQVVWFSGRSKHRLPSVCEHLPFHAAMVAHGHDRIFINPQLKVDR